MIQLIQISLDDLGALIENAVNKALDERNLNSSVIASQDEGKLITRKELASMLNVSFVTIHNYSKKGLLIKHKVGNRVLFKLSEVQTLLSRVA